MSLDEAQFINSVFSDNQLSLTRTKSTSIPNNLNSQQSLQTLANLDDPKIHKRESSRVFNNYIHESIESQETSFDYASFEQLESQIFVQRKKEKEGVNQMCLLKGELDSFIGLLQRVKAPQEDIEGIMKQNLSVIISTDESQISKQSPVQDYYSFTNQTSRTSRISQIPSDCLEDQQTNVQFQNMVDQKREIIQEGFKRCIQALQNICKKHNINEALQWIDKLATIQVTIIIQQAVQIDKCYQASSLNEANYSPQIQALRECLSQQEKELDLNLKQSQQKDRYQSQLEQELKNIYQEQSSERQQIVELQQKNLKNLILLANRQYEDLVLKLSQNEKKFQQYQTDNQEQTKLLLQSNKVLRSVIIASGDEKAEQIVNVLLTMVDKNQKKCQKIDPDIRGRQKSEGQTRQQSDSLGRSTKENIKDLKKSPITNKTGYHGESQKSPLSTLRSKMTEFNSSKKILNRSIR